MVDPSIGGIVSVVRARLFMTSTYSSTTGALAALGEEVLGVFDAERPLPDRRVRVRRHWQRPAPGQRRTAPPARPQRALRHRQRRPATARADPLIVAVRSGQLVAEPQPALDLDQILDVHARAECVPAPAAVRQLLGPPRILIEPDAKLRGPLEDVE